MMSRSDADQEVHHADEVYGRRRRRVLRVLGSGAASCFLALGLLATSVASVPWNDLPVRPADPVEAEPVSVGRIGSRTN